MREKLTIPTREIPTMQAGGRPLTRHSDIITGDRGEHPLFGRPRGLGLGESSEFLGGVHGLNGYARMDSKDISVLNLCFKALYGGLGLVLEKITVGVVRIAHKHIDNFFKDFSETNKTETTEIKNHDSPDKLVPTALKTHYTDPTSSTDNLTSLGGQDTLLT